MQPSFDRLISLDRNRWVLLKLGGSLEVGVSFWFPVKSLQKGHKSTGVFTSPFHPKRGSSTLRHSPKLNRSHTR